MKILLKAIIKNILKNMRCWCLQYFYYLYSEVVPEEDTKKRLLVSLWNRDRSG